MSLSARSGWFDEANRVYIKYSIASIMEDLNCSKQTAVGAVKDLNDIGLIDMIQQNGKANIIYVKNFVSQDKSEQVDRSKKQTSKKSVPQVEDQSDILTGTESEPVQKEDEDDIHTGTSTESGLPPVKNLDPNNNDFNNTNVNETINENYQKYQNKQAMSKTLDLKRYLEGLSDSPEDRAIAQARGICAQTLRTAGYSILQINLLHPFIMQNRSADELMKLFSKDASEEEIENLLKIFS